MATGAITRDKYERLEGRLKRWKTDAKEAAKTTTTSVLAVGGGAIAGYLGATKPYIGDSEVPTAAALGSVLVAASLSGMLDEYGDHMAALGSGMLAAVAARETEKVIRAKEAEGG